MHNKKALSDLFRQGFFWRIMAAFLKKSLAKNFMRKEDLGTAREGIVAFYKLGKKLYEEGGFGDC